jgi:hypothetical protein
MPMVKRAKDMLDWMTGKKPPELAIGNPLGRYFSEHAPIGGHRRPENYEEAHPEERAEDWEENRRQAAQQWKDATQLMPAEAWRKWKKAYEEAGRKWEETYKETHPEF